MNAVATQFPEMPTPAAVLERTWRATWFVGESKLDHGIEQHAVYTADQMHQYARDYAAMLAAAPAASGGESHHDALPDGTLSKSTAKRVEALAAASVSERARAMGSERDEILSTLSGLRRRYVELYDANIHTGTEGVEVLENFKHESARLCFDHFAALEQALTQQRGESEAFHAACDMFLIGADARNTNVLLGNLSNVKRFAEYLHAIEHEFFMVPGEPDEDSPDDEPEPECLVNSWGSTQEQYVEQFRAALAKITTPQPSADAVREVIGSMRNFADVADNCELTEGNAQVAIRAWATQLETLLSGGSHA